MFLSSVFSPLYCLIRSCTSVFIQCSCSLFLMAPNVSDVMKFLHLMLALLASPCMSLCSSISLSSHSSTLHLKPHRSVSSQASM